MPTLHGNQRVWPQPSQRHCQYSEQVRRQNASLSHSTRQVKTSREISAPFYTGTSNRKPVFYNIQEHIGYSSFHQFDKKAIVAHLVKRFRQVKGAYVNHRTTVDIVIDNTTQCEYIACAQLLPCLKSKWSLVLKKSRYLCNIQCSNTLDMAGLIDMPRKQCFIQIPKHWGEKLRLVGGRRSSAEGARSSRRRRRDRDAEGVEGVGKGDGVSPPQPTKGSGGASWAPSVGSRAEPRPKTNLVHSRAVRKPLVAIILSVLSACFTPHTGPTSTN